MTRAHTRAETASPDGKRVRGQQAEEDPTWEEGDSGDGRRAWEEGDVNSYLRCSTARSEVLGANAFARCYTTVASLLPTLMTRQP